jgi:hypothetical protein
LHVPPVLGFFGVYRLGAVTLGCPQQGGNRLGDLHKPLARNLLDQIKPIAAATLGADKPTHLALIIPPEAVFAVANRTWTVRILKEPSVYPQQGQDGFPMPLCHLCRRTHATLPVDCNFDFALALRMFLETIQLSVAGLINLAGLSCSWWAGQTLYLSR